MSLVLVLDCGATNLRAIAVDPEGQIVASQYLKNETVTGLTGVDHHIWDFEQIWQKLCQCAKSVITQVGAENVVALTVTTFGVDGAPFDENEQQIYPIISWKCPRTIETMKQVEKDIDRVSLYQVNGIGDYSFNTLTNSNG
ncbi:L-fuculokinase [Vibrio variabilis]|uniref:L-fuculokinase n=1 Tax=Vibrio variabilis TaxID=990271 RepID=A0ABQ0JHG2_9VIBR|nr:L-fuculokinase [Vibrio variabilis]